MTNKKTCEQCRHAEWQKTKTGRIKKGARGRCLMKDQLLEFCNIKTAPCIVMSRPRAVHIWPNYDASFCQKWEEIDSTKPGENP